ncbi:DUF6168 family protein [Zobellia barbeyronii]|uniref:Integral membrane protein n=1 Tax=Zobellia barbeyronii TaxID=2748009 RepID=A0ABS5WAD8_9FLAO|nr:DUF6168 family protein [Zobellia barbeyronii]MBT2160371.1 hypothetical protein [Zobellia barbeyronii]
MIKQIVQYIVVFILVGTTSFFLHQFLLADDNLSFNTLLKEAYIFHFIFSLAVIITFQLLSKNEKVFAQVGFIYMGTLVFKIAAYTAMCYPQLMGDQYLPRFYRASLLIPVFVFLALEVFFVSKILERR